VTDGGVWWSSGKTLSTGRCEWMCTIGICANGTLPSERSLHIDGLV